MKFQSHAARSNWDSFNIFWTGQKIMSKFHNFWDITRRGSKKFQPNFGANNSYCKE